MKLIDCSLVPCDLYPNKYELNPRLIVLGTCGAESLVDAGISKNMLVQHYLWESWNDNVFPDFDSSNIDGLVVHLTLRHILKSVDGLERGDISYITTSIDQMSIKVDGFLDDLIKNIMSHYGTKNPLFFLSFIEPPQTTRGFFSANRSESIYRLVRNINDSMQKILQKYPNAYYVEVNDILAYYGCGESADSYKQHFTHAGNSGNQQSLKFYKAILQRIVNALETIKAVLPVKLIVTDLDNTFWNGIPAEEDEIIPWAHTEGWPIGYIEALLECKRRGIVLAISSKNDETQTLNSFRKIWGAKITPEDFFSIKINWESKSSNIAQIMAEANILPSNTLFIDDNPLEIEEVKQAFPEIRTLTVPQQHWRNVLLHSPQTQSATFTKESEQRTVLLKAKVERDKISQNMDRDTYLQSLNLQVRINIIRGADHSNYARAFELLNKTNQFNTTGKRWTESELSSLFQESGCLFVASVSDRLANHGLTSVAVVSANKLLQFVLSCRVFGLGIETALLHQVLETQRNVGCTSISALSKDSGRNASSREFYSRHNFVLVDTDIDGVQYWQSSGVPSVPSWISVVTGE
ncbi:HAD-IIIC family phosphatase [Acidithiobacillus montserratensis]|uniref:HAD-IIIC family phosphatase n=1 Tax=Acidithiobacillus montserratensis TaxID=2729135 RepID=A0ACD5HGF7_9PROT|nr:HAD-IIIC family phosphatase [Acidithiobacillus montserratensis]MBN2679348.1 HAD-IIIC family phosphatase [Acidithiobacillaceae bacterium]MBU2747602.1 HAD-IIIC family phosphatase [Acidithiobacillus montserratensis]